MKNIYKYLHQQTMGAAGGLLELAITVGNVSSMIDSLARLEEYDANARRRQCPVSHLLSVLRTALRTNNNELLKALLKIDEVKEDLVACLETTVVSTICDSIKSAGARAQTSSIAGVFSGLLTSPSELNYVEITKFNHLSEVYLDEQCYKYIKMSANSYGDGLLSSSMLAEYLKVDDRDFSANSFATQLMLGLNDEFALGIDINPEQAKDSLEVFCDQLEKFIARISSYNNGIDSYEVIKAFDSVSPSPSMDIR